jgi:ESS family glutamate:Na+ symporter
MINFWDFSVWGSFMLFAVLLGSLLVANILKKSVPFLEKSLIPTSVLGGVILLAVAFIYKLITDDVLFDTAFFGGNGSATLETLTYHTLALGFIATALKTTGGKLNKKRTSEIFNTGVTTVGTYLLQALLGMGITMVAALVIDEFFSASGILLAFGFGQGTGQAMNYGGIYESDFGFVGGKSFGLTIAAIGFLCASVGGVIHLNILRRRGKIKVVNTGKSSIIHSEIQSENEIPMQESMDKMTVQIALMAVSYLFAYMLMFGLGNLLPGMRSVVYGFNFLLGVLCATLVKTVLNFLNKKKLVKRQYTNNFLLTRAGNFFFDIMVVAGIAAIRLDMLEKYWGIIAILVVVGTVATYAYNRFVAKTLFSDYAEEQFLAMYGMLTGTASTGVILLREIDGEFRTPVSDNLVYQNFPAIVFGFPMMLLATLAPKKPLLTLILFGVLFLIMNLMLFRSYIFKRKKNKN